MEGVPEVRVQTRPHGGRATSALAPPSPNSLPPQWSDVALESPGAPHSATGSGKENSAVAPHRLEQQLFSHTRVSPGHFLLHPHARHACTPGVGLPGGMCVPRGTADAVLRTPADRTPQGSAGSRVAGVGSGSSAGRPVAGSESRRLRDLAHRHADLLADVDAAQRAKAQARPGLPRRGVPARRCQVHSSSCAALPWR